MRWRGKLLPSCLATEKLTLSLASAVPQRLSESLMMNFSGSPNKSWTHVVARIGNVVPPNRASI